MDKIKHVLNPGKEKDDEILYGSGRSDDPIHSDNQASSGLSSGTPGATAGYGSGYDTSNTGPGGTAGPHSSNLANKLDPRVDSDRDGSRPFGGSGTTDRTGVDHSTVGYGDVTQSQHGDALAGNVNKPLPHTPASFTESYPQGSSGTDLPDRTVSRPSESHSNLGGDHGSHGGLLGAIHSHDRPSHGSHDPNYSSTADKPLPSQGPVPVGSAYTGLDTPEPTYHISPFQSSGNTAGPHSSSLANKVDPRVDSDRDGSRILGSTGAPQAAYSTPSAVSGAAYPGTSGISSRPLGDRGAQDYRPEYQSSDAPSQATTGGLGYGNTGSTGPIRSYQDMPTTTTMYADDPARAPDAGYIENILDPSIRTDPTPVAGQGQQPVSGSTYSGDSHPSGLQSHGGSGLDRSNPLGSTSQSSQYGPSSGTQYSDPHHGRDTALFAGGAAATGAALTGGHHSHDPSESSTSGTGPHKSNILNKLDPRVDSDHDGSRTAGAGPGVGSTGYTGAGVTQTQPYSGTTSAYHPTSTESTSSAAGPHKSGILNKLDPRVDSDRDGSRTADRAPGTSSTQYMGAVGGTSHAQPFSGTTSGHNPTSTESTSAATGPHKSNILNKLDPRVDSDGDGSRGVGTVPGTQHRDGSHSTPHGGSTTGYHPTSTESTSSAPGPHKSGILNKLDPRVDSDRDGSRTVGTGPGFGHGEHRTGVDDGRSGHHGTSAMPILAGTGAAAAASQYPRDSDPDRSRYNESDVGEKKHGLFHRGDEKATHTEDTHRHPAEHRDDKEHHGLLGGLLHRDKDKDLEAERERERARHAKEQERHLKEEKKHHHEEKKHHHEEKKHHHEEKKHHHDDKKHHKDDKDKDHHGLLGGLLHRDKDKDKDDEAERRRIEEERLRQEEAKKHDKEHHGLLGGLLHHNKEKEHDKHDKHDKHDTHATHDTHDAHGRSTHHEKPLTTHDAYPAAAEHHEPNKLHKDPPPEIAAQMAGHDGRNKTGDDGIVTEPHTGLPMNVGKYGSGAGGTDGGPQPGYHKH